MPTYHVPIAKILPLAIATTNNKLTLEFFLGINFLYQGLTARQMKKVMM
jgi:hypothetical protein